MSYRTPAEMIPETPTMQWRRIGRWFGGGAGIGAGAALVWVLSALIVLWARACGSTMSDYWIVTLDARAYVRDLWREAEFAAVRCSDASGSGPWRCDVFVRWPDRSEHRELVCTAGRGCSEDANGRRPTQPGEPGHRHTDGGAP